jgi:phospholipid/cholesterol/gamma-HCH transport system permease protein
MSTAPSRQPAAAPPGRFRRAMTTVGLIAFAQLDLVRDCIAFVGGMALLLRDVFKRLGGALLAPKAKLGRASLFSQMMRVGVRSIPIVILVQTFIGIILALQMAPTLQAYGQVERTADIVAIAVFRELGPLISAIVLSGFAGASIAAELGAMVEGEEIKALRAVALNPVQFLVVPRVLATTVMLVALAVVADVVGVLGGLFTAVAVLNIDDQTYISATQLSLKHRDFLTGLVKAGVFGLLISLIACYEGLNVRGGAEGVGRATTGTVVKSIVALIATDCLFTAVFYAYGL